MNLFYSNLIRVKNCVINGDMPVINCFFSSPKKVGYFYLQNQIYITRNKMVIRSLAGGILAEVWRAGMTDETRN
jgi:hypothetical protein